MADIRVSNIKVSLKSNLRKGPPLDLKAKEVKNFWVYRGEDNSRGKEQRTFVYIIFPRGHINITGIKRIKHIAEAKGHLSKQIRKTIKNFKIIKCNIDSISAHGRLSKNEISLWQLAKTEHSHPIIKSVEFDPCTFPALKIFTSIGTALIFSNGKCNLTGCKNLTQVQTLYFICKSIFDTRTV